MFRNRILKILALLMVLNILIIPLTSFTPQQQNKYKVYAAEGIVDIRFFNAVISMIGITAAGLATMSPSFTIPEADLVQMKNNFEQSLEADAVKKQAWLAAQTDYLAGGIAKTMGAVELSKIGINDIYNDFCEYLKKNISIKSDVEVIENNTYIKTMGGYDLYSTADFSKLLKPGVFINTVGIWYDRSLKDNDLRNKSGSLIVKNNTTGVTKTILTLSNGENYASVYFYHIDEFVPSDRSLIYNILSIYGNILGIDISKNNTLSKYKSDNVIQGNIDYTNTGNIINTTNEYLKIYPTIPWIDATVPIGTVVTPAISAPYAGVVPIDVPITAPIDPPIDEPVDPPIEEPTTLLGTVAAILAGITPISAILNNILASELDIADVIEVGITDVIDGIGDIARTLTDGITTSLTDIQTSIGSLLEPPTETLHLDKLKNLNSVLFTKFPFSIPFDFIAIVTAINADPVAPVLSIPFNFQDFGGSNTNVEIDLSIYDNFANIARQIGFIGFVIFMLFNTRKLIWK